MFNFDIQRFGSTTVSNSTPVNGATQLTETGKEIEGINRDYLRVLSPVLQNLARTGGAQVGQGGTIDYASMYGTGLNQVNAANNNINALASGQLPSAYKANMQQAVSDAIAPYQYGVSNLGANGTVNSSLMRALATDTSRAANAAALNAYNTNMNSAFGLAQGQAAAAANPFNYAAGYQQAATSNAKDLLSLATGSYQPVGSTFSDYLKAGTGQKSSSTSTDNSGLWGALGTGAGLAFCFPANTKIATANGDVNIQDVKVGDKVSTLCGEQEVTKTMQSIQPIMQINTDRGKLRCTETEVLLSVDGPVNAGDLINGDVLIHKDGGAMVYDVQFDVDECMVYEIVVPWFYADGFVIDGFDPEVE